MNFREFIAYCEWENPVETVLKINAEEKKIEAYANVPNVVSTSSSVRFQKSIFELCTF